MATINPRVGITVAPELKKWFEEQSGTMGISTSGLIVVAMTQYRQQAQALNSMQGLPALMEELKKIQVRQEKLEKENKKNG